jgi:hypothetical protein
MKSSLSVAALIATATLTLATTSYADIAATKATVSNPASYSEKSIKQSFVNHKISQNLYNYIVARTRSGNSYVLLGRQIPELKIKHADIFKILFEDKAGAEKLNAAQVKVVTAMTIEALSSIKAGQAQAPAAGAQNPSGNNTQVNSDITGMALCFGATGALFALPHPYSYIAAGGVFAACMVWYGDQIFLNLKLKN